MNDLFVSDFTCTITTIKEQRVLLTEAVKWFQQQEDQEEALQAVAKERGLTVDVLRQHDCFFINEQLTLIFIPEKYKDETLGLVRNNYIVYSGRFVYPVKDPTGLVMGLCGWDPYVQPKYLDSKNFGYKAKHNTMYGMEKLYGYYKSNKPVIVVEGIVDCLLLRDNGFQALAALGSMLTAYIITILLRFKDRCIVIPDNDNYKGDAEDRTAGEGFVKQVFWRLPDAKVYQTTTAKDLDDVARSSELSRLNLLDDLRNIDNMFYEFKELRQRVKPGRKKVSYGKII